MRRFAQLLVGLGSMAFVLGTLVVPASAGSVTGTDPRDGLPPGDIRAVRLTQDGSQLAIRIRTEGPLNVLTAPAWHGQASKTLLRVWLETSRTIAGPEWLVRISTHDGNVSGALVPLAERSPRIVCVNSRPQPQLTMLELVVELDCLKTRGPIRAAVSYRFDQRGDGSVNSIDRAPNTGFGPRLQLED